MSYLEHAKREFKALGYDLEDKEEGPNKWIMENIFELLEVFSKQGHSGHSAPYCISLFKNMANLEPCSPLTGEDWEWYEYDTGKFQNIRCSHVFKDNEKAYDVEGIIFEGKDGVCWTNINSHVRIEFPYTPKRIYKKEE